MSLLKNHIFFKNYLKRKKKFKKTKKRINLNQKKNTKKSNFTWTRLKKQMNS